MLSFIYLFILNSIIISEIKFIQPEKSLTLFSSILFEVFIFKKKDDKCDDMYIIL